MVIPDRETVTRGAIYSDPARVRCGECGAVHTLTDPETTAAKEAQAHGWTYTFTSGWVCPLCAPLERLTSGEPNRVHEGRVG